MRTCPISLGAGLLAGVVHNLLGIRSPAPPVAALLGRLGILLGEQILPVVARVTAGHTPLSAVLHAGTRQHVFGRLPGHGAVTQDPA